MEFNDIIKSIDIESMKELNDECRKIRASEDELFYSYENALLQTLKSNMYKRINGVNEEKGDTVITAVVAAMLMYGAMPEQDKLELQKDIDNFNECTRQSLKEAKKVAEKLKGKFDVVSPEMQ